MGFYVLERELNWDKYHRIEIRDGIKLEARVRLREGEINFKTNLCELN